MFVNILFSSVGSFLGCFNNGNWLDCLKAVLEQRLVAKFLKEKAALCFNRSDRFNQLARSSFALGQGLSLLAPKTSPDHNPDFQLSL
jgi:hypothetical protein